MSRNDEDRAALQRFKAYIDNDDIKIKERVKKLLLNNRLLVRVLNNKVLEAKDAEPEDYFNVNIFPMYMIPQIQSSVENFVCYEVDTDAPHYGANPGQKNVDLIFTILCHKSQLIDEDTGIARHDLLAALIQYDFNWSNWFGRKMRLISDVSGTTDNDYATRTLTFRQITDNTVVKTKPVLYTAQDDIATHYVPMIANKEVTQVVETEN